MKRINPATFLIFSAVLLCIYGLAIYCAVFNHELYLNLLEDGGRVEQLAIIFTVISAILFILSFFKHTQPKSFLFLVFSILVIFAINGVVYRLIEFYFLGIPLLLFILPRLHDGLIKLKVPVASPATAFLTLLNYLLFTYCFEGFVGLHGDLGRGLINYGEMFETGFKLVVLHFSLECFTRGVTWTSTEEVLSYSPDRPSYIYKGVIQNQGKEPIKESSV